MQDDLRRTALRAARSYLRRQGIDPMTVSPKSALAALDDLMKIDGALDAAIWYMNSTDDKAETKRFKREWNAWRKNAR